MRAWNAASGRRRSTAVVGTLIPTMILVAACAGAGTPAPTPAYWPTDGWRTAAPETQGLDSAKLAEGLLAIRGKGLTIHSLLLARKGELLLDAYFYPYDGSTVHELQSVTKSVTTTLIAIAADKGKLGLDDTLVSFFPDRTIANRDARKERITVRHLASMSSGLACTAEGDERTLEEMKSSPDWVQFALDLPMAAEPGSKFVYCSPGMHLLSAILQAATGMTELEFAQQYLFGPLGISEVLWHPDPQGYTRGWAQLHLLPRDAAKIGYLWASGGEWDGTQIVPRAWVEDSVKVQLKTGGPDDYGYGWWLPRNTTTGEYAAIGRGGQRIAVHRGMDMVIVTTAGGIEPSEATDLLEPAVSDLDKPLPANPAGVEALAAAIAAVGEPPAAQPVPAMPATAREVSGRTWRFGANQKSLATIRLDFGSGPEGGLEMTFSNGQRPLTGKVGLDGVYRFGPGLDVLPAAFRGHWTDEQTFELEFDEIADQEAFAMELRFEADRLTLQLRERTHESGLVLEAVPDL